MKVSYFLTSQFYIILFGRSTPENDYCFQKLFLFIFLVQKNLIVNSWR